eukprot:CAMPEP_0168544010 /NCGR_PEP_ID=MMETSP0413-20121227/2196_1 /TAXON_ID=136452 /ORGANISM="Filamoeba nolandi, Strain NC-AS-23-1" /LENGTH=415 /DNA_ID=CAMNT_0008574011 /DNA_START=28 /DNA_END=1271 /DNA_ORIENTATION=+
MAKMLDPEIQEFSWYHCVGEYNKSLVLKIHNNSFWVMQRVEFKLQHGHWIAEPPATILPKETAYAFAACHTLPRVEGSVMYKFVSPTQKPSGTLNIRVDKVNWVAFRWNLPVLGGKHFEEEKVDGADALYFGIEKSAGDINSWCTIARWSVVQKIQSPQTHPNELISMNSTSYVNVSPSMQPNAFSPTVPPSIPHQSPLPAQNSPLMFPQTPSTQPAVAPAPSALPLFPSPPASHPTQAPTTPVVPSQPPQTSQPSQPAPKPNNSGLNAYQQKILDGYLDSLNQKSEEEMPPIDGHTGINIYYHMAQTWWDQGNHARKNGNLEDAYILFMRYMTFVLERIPAHMSYGLMKNDDYRSAAKAKCVKLMKELEPMQQQLVEAKKKELLDNPTGLAFPSVPSHHSNPPPNNNNSGGNPP